MNKVNTKVALRCAVDAEWVPVWARGELEKEVSLSHFVFLYETEFY